MRKGFKNMHQFGYLAVTKSNEYTTFISVGFTIDLHPEGIRPNGDKQG